ncbi:hypothetical protein B0T25DRAFT_457677 [Lasiosphaeria hispida]|uniref:DUF8021 domain-containing protein n=1 Tax=Lasiosphaeria hispida TaxID=260671 RepID=A0AAJ0HFA6_9PEZI|nr:hypothetical protein B0T25DRAFT_457677 [Lasiosphaeria hispida]
MIALYAAGIWAVFGASVTGLAINGSPLVPRAANCSREVLLEAADAYIAAQTAGKLDPLQKVLASNWTYEENNKVVADTKKGVLNKALKIDHRRTIVDLVVCASFTELISAEAANPYVIGTQIRHGADNKVTLIDSVASTTGSWIFDAKKTLSYVQQEKWDPIPEGKRDSRAAIQAAGDAYLDMWSSSTASNLVPWGTPCTRLEGSAYTGKGRPDDSCKAGIPSNHNQAPNTRRRYVIDESMGSVSILLVWEHMMMAADSHEFRLEGGKVRYIHTMTECGGKTCRL